MKISKYDTDWETAFNLCKSLGLGSSDIVIVRPREPQMANNLKEALALFQLGENEQRMFDISPAMPV